MYVVIVLLLLFIVAIIHFGAAIRFHMYHPEKVELEHATLKTKDNIRDHAPCLWKSPMTMRMSVHIGAA